MAVLAHRVKYPVTERSVVKHRRIIVTHYSGPDALQVLEVKCPEPTHGEVRVKVMAAVVSLPVLMMCAGIHPETPRLPFTSRWD
jgi:NADPH:quinone reductase-like Zn-dependent oxidoreductase